MAKPSTGISVKTPIGELAVSEDVATKAGTWLSRVVGEPVEHAIGFATDLLRIRRRENCIKLVIAAQERLAARGIHEPTRLLPMKVALPLIEAASLEEEPTLQDMWVNLLANGVDADFPFDVTPSFVDVLRMITPYEAQILRVIYATAPRDASTTGALVTTAGLPESAQVLASNNTGVRCGYETEVFAAIPSCRASQAAKAREVAKCKAQFWI